jgi:hypothetical protein
MKAKQTQGMQPKQGRLRAPRIWRGGRTLPRNILTSRTERKISAFSTPPPKKILRGKKTVNL